MYHAVSTKATEDWGPWQYTLTPDEFEQQIAWLSQHSSIVSINALITYLRGEAQLPENSVVLTFDDAYRNFVSQALPVLKEYNVPSTLYVPTALMSSGTAPYEFRLATTLQESDEVTIQIDGCEHKFWPTTTTAIREAYTELRPLIEALSIEDREAFLCRNDIAECSGFEVLSTEAVRELDDEHSITIGSHGHHHRRLGAASNTKIEQETRVSRSQLSELLNQPAEHFSFPYGSHSRPARQAVKTVGFSSAVTTECRLVRPRDWNHRYALPRVDMAAGDSDIPRVLERSL
jgi:peptidoglycan/xylan/chitin deacetylase (PgdA/CDA1 family)